MRPKRQTSCFAASTLPNSFGALDLIKHTQAVSESRSNLSVSLIKHFKCCRCMSLNSVGLELNAMCTVWKAGHHWVLSFRWDLLTDKMHCIRCQQPSAPPFSNISHICYFSSFFSLSLFLCLHTLTDSFSIYPERELEKLL